MSAFSDYLESALIGHILRGVTYTAPTTVWVSAHTADPTDAGTATETTGTSYARVAVTCSTANWTAPGVGGLTDNVSAITFPTAGGSWGTITHVGIYDASSSGNLLLSGSLSASKAITTSDTLEFAIGDLDITLA